MSQPVQDQPSVPRRLFFAGAGTAAAVGVTQAMASPADAAPGTTAWMLGGTAGVTSDGTNWLGPQNMAPIIFKTVATSGGTPAERMRLTPYGSLGIGVTAPSARMEVKGFTNSADGIKVTSPNSAGGATAVRGVCDAGAGITGVSANNVGVSASGGYMAFSGSGTYYGAVLYGTGASGTGAYCSGSTYGVLGYGSTYGLYGSGDDGVHGAGSTNGVYGSGATGVSGHGGSIGVYGGDASNAGIRGDSTYVGVWGQGTSYGAFVLATTTSGSNYGLYAATNVSGGTGIYCEQNCHVAGTLSKSAGSFKIDHPLDPEHKWLSHSFVESPDMMNVYNGNVTLDGEGKATVRLPAYFTALNKDYRYQLTAIGGPARDLHVSGEVRRNAFTIAGGTPHGQVSWQVTGIRQDPYAREHPIVVETDKRGHERGALAFVPEGSSATKIDARPRPVAPPARHAVGAVADPRPHRRGGHAPTR